MTTCTHSFIIPAFSQNAGIFFWGSAVDKDVTPCAGSPRFLDWLAKYNRAQTDLEVSNRVMGWDKRGNARHGINCACVGPAGSDVQIHEPEEAATVPNATPTLF